MPHNRPSRPPYAAGGTPLDNLGRPLGWPHSRAGPPTLSVEANRFRRQRTFTDASTIGLPTRAPELSSAQTRQRYLPAGRLEAGT